MSSCTLIWALLVAALLEWKLGVLRATLYTARLAYERATAPVITVPVPRTDFSAVAAAPAPLTPATARPAIQCFEKGTNRPIGVVPAATPAEVASRVGAARVAQRCWASSSFATRRRLLFALMDYVLLHHEVLCRTAAVECGKTMVDGTFGEVLTTLEKLRWTAASGEAALREEVRGVGLIAMHKRASVRYVPFGVIGAVVSWNYPFHNIWGPMISALFAGNAFVGKVSEWSAFYAGFYERIVREGLEKLGYSGDLVHFVPGYADAGQAVVEMTDKVTFIGSPGVGKLVMEAAAKTLTPVVLELGGKDPAVICEDADFATLVPVIMRGTFQNCGQNCVGLERIMLHTAAYDTLVPRLAALVSGLSQAATDVTLADGDCTSPVGDCGAMTMGEAACEKVQALVDDAVAKGARLLVGGRRDAAGQDRRAGFYPPTLLVDVTPSMAIARDEVFGPVMVVFRCASDDEAIAMVNDCPYGLGASVFTGDKKRADRIGAALRTGMLNVNDFGINYLCQGLPFGGIKISGFDRFAGIEGLRGNCVLRAETRDRIPGVKTSVPPQLQYPTTAASFRFSVFMCRVLYGTIPQAVGGLLGMLTCKKVPTKVG